MSEEIKKEEEEVKPVKKVRTMIEADDIFDFSNIKPVAKVIVAQA